MKKPRNKDLVYDPVGTSFIRSIAKNSKKIKITLLIDEDSVIELKKRAAQTGAKYQTLLNKILKDNLISSKDDTKSRLEKIEKEIEKLKSMVKKAA